MEAVLDLADTSRIFPHYNADPGIYSLQRQSNSVRDGHSSNSTMKLEICIVMLKGIV